MPRHHHQFLSYAVRQGLIEYNPGIGVGAVKSEARDRVLSESEIKALWTAFAPPNVTTAMGLTLRMAMVTLQRGNEVAGMRWSEIDRKARTWTLPAGRMKAKRAHRGP
jgi:integrase